MSNVIPIKPSHLPQFVGYAEVEAALGVSRRTVERMVREGKFRMPVQLTPNRVGWKVDTVTGWLDERSIGLAARAVASPDDLSPEQVEDAALALVMRAIENETGEPVDPAGLRITYARPSVSIPEEEFAKAEAEEADLLQHRFEGFDAARSCVMTAWLFPKLRQMLADGTEDDAVRQQFLDEEKLRRLTLTAMNDISWEHGLPALKELPPNARR